MTLPYTFTSISSIPGFFIGSAEDEAARTGATVILCPEGAWAGADVSGGGPASREMTLVADQSALNPVHGVLLAGGSAFGLAAADGVMAYLEERGVGYDTGYAKVPLVLGSCLYDLAVGDPHRRPDRAMGYAACVAAEQNQPRAGRYGAGCGATIGKLHGLEQSSPAGLGLCCLRLGELLIGAVVAVNALGDVYDPDDGHKLAGMGDGDSEMALYELFQPGDLFAGRNTTLGCLLTNAAFTRWQMNRIAAQARAGLARTIRPVGTTFDGDTIYALSHGQVEADLNVAGTLAARALAYAVKAAVEDNS